jgi:hypothetical protein
VAPATWRRHARHLAMFGEYLRASGVEAPGVEEMQAGAEAWRGITREELKGFVRWQLGAGWAVRSVDLALNTVRVYTRMAARAGAILAEEMAEIEKVNRGYVRAQARGETG